MITTTPKHTATSDQSPQLSSLLSPEGTLQALAYFSINTRPGAHVLGSSRDPGFQGDGSNLYTVINSPVDGRGPVLCKVGWGEYSKPGLDGTHHYSPESKLERCSLPLFCIRQSDSHFADADQQAMMKNDPVGYLKKHCELSKQGGNVCLGPLATVQVLSFEQGVNQMIESRIAMSVGAERWREFIKMLPSSAEALKQLHDITKRTTQIAYTMLQETSRRDEQPQSSQISRIELMDIIYGHFRDGIPEPDRSMFTGLTSREIKLSLETVHMFQRCIGVMGLMNAALRFQDNPFAKLNLHEDVANDIASIFPILKNQQSSATSRSS